MQTKKVARLRRAKKTRKLIRSTGKLRLTINRSNQHIYAQIIDKLGNILVQASTLDAELKELEVKSNIEAASKVGALVAQRAQEKGVDGPIAFDRSGYLYHGRVKALADGARSSGLSF